MKLLSTCVLLALSLALFAPASAQLADDRLLLLPTQIQDGPGTVRLDGMGGFEAAVLDENFETNLHDFSRNPAGFGDDRDSWTIDFRYSYDEMKERDERSRGNDLKISGGSMVVAYHSPGDMGLGGTISYSELVARDFTKERGDFKLSGLELVGNRYFFDRLSVGLRLSQSSENQETFSSRIYKIDHDATYTRAGLGVAYQVSEGVMVGARGQLFSQKIDGTSRGPFHTDTFDWSRPGGLGSIHVFVNRGRLNLGADYTRKDEEGDESVKISWSERFLFNPTNEIVTRETGTFTEDRQEDRLRARAHLSVSPSLRLGAALARVEQSFKVAENPNAIGSRATADVKAEGTSAIVGASWVAVSSRLLLAGELKFGSTKLEERVVAGDRVTDLNEFLIRVGGEYLIGETLVTRLGLNQGTQDLSFSHAPDRDDTFNKTGVAVGIGLVPTGGIWQLDLAYDVILDSGLDEDRSRISAYIRHLF